MNCAKHKFRARAVALRSWSDYKSGSSYNDWGRELYEEEEYRERGQFRNYASRSLDLSPGGARESSANDRRADKKKVEPLVLEGLEDAKTYYCKKANELQEDVVERLERYSPDVQFSELPPKERYALNLLRAVHLFEERREDPEGLCVLGMLFELGYGVKRDERLARLCYSRARRYGSLLASVCLAFVYRYGIGAEPNEEKYKKYLKFAKEHLGALQKWVLPEKCRELTVLQNNMTYVYPRNMCYLVVRYFKNHKQDDFGLDLSKIFTKQIGVINDLSKKIASPTMSKKMFTYDISYAE